jgi:hypothetical protein
MRRTAIKQSSRIAASILIFLTMMAGATLPATAQKRRPAPKRYTVRANSVIRVRMNNKLSSKTANVGDRFTTTVVDPVYVGGIEVVPAGSTLTGRVTTVKRAARKSKAGEMGADFISIRTPAGRTYAISGSLASSEDGEVNTDNEGGVKGKSSKKRNIGFIGGGAAGGALIGAIAGGGSGAAIGAGVGAGLGIAGSLLSKGKEAEVKPGTEFGVILNRNVLMYASR